MNCSIIVICGLCLGICGALLAALPWGRLDAGIAKLVPKLGQAGAGIAKLRAVEDIRGHDKELNALNWLLGTNAKVLSREKNKDVMFERTGGILAPAEQLIKDENGRTVSLLIVAQRELSTRIRDTRTYIGLGIMAVGFILQLLGILS